MMRIMRMMRMMRVTVKDRRMRMPKNLGWGKATTKQNLTRSSADCREDCTPDREPEKKNTKASQIQIQRPTKTQKRDKYNDNDKDKDSVTSAMCDHPLLQDLLHAQVRHPQPKPNCHYRRQTRVFYDCM